MKTTLDELKQQWKMTADPAPVTASAFDQIVKARVTKITGNSFQFFWASLTLQIIVYSLLSHVIVKYGGDTVTLLFGISGILLYVPFTIMLLRKFKGMAKGNTANGRSLSLHGFALVHQKELGDFYRFKKRYELILIPLSSLIAVYLIFALYVPGRAETHVMGASFITIATIASCAVAIRNENKKSFALPLMQLDLLIREFQD